MRLFDTTFLIDLVNGDKGAVEKAARVDEEAAFNAISVATAHEYLRGIFYLYHEDSKLLRSKLKRAEAELARFEALPYTYEIAKRAAEIDAGLAKSGVTLSLVDIIIAATALHYKLAVVTRDVNHFKRMPGLEIETY